MEGQQWVRWSLALLCACCLAGALQPEQQVGRVRRLTTYVVQQQRQRHPGQSGYSSSPLLLLSRPYSASSSSVQERTRRMSQAGPSLQHTQAGTQAHHHHQQPGGSSSHQSGGHGVPSSKVQQEARGGSTHAQQHKQHQLQGVNVCGGQCCQGWSKASGSDRCTKPNCTPACQNGGMCLRPQFCICKPGTKGKACETTASTSVSGGHVLPARPIPQQSAPQDSLHRQQSTSNNSPVGQMTLTLKQKMPVAIPQQVQPHLVPLSSQALTMNLHQGQTQQFVMKPKYYSNTQKALLGGEQSTDGLLPLRAGQDHSLSPFQLVNHTGRIKVVFTPTICKVTCTKGNCQNTCEKGNTTTLISENGHAADTLTSTNFRVVICHLPCMNGGQCSARDKCQCPPNFTGKLCQIPVQNTNFQKQYQHPQQANKVTGSHVIHSTHSLPLTVAGQHQGVKVKLPPSMVNIHVKHPPEASIMFHQVSRVDSSSTGHKVNDAQAGHSQVSYHSIPIQNKQQGAHSTYQHQQTISHHYPVSAKTQLGRCFQETVGSQCGKALPGLSKQEDCCGTVGTSWGFNKCQKCPKKTTYQNYGQLLECPQGYKRVNATFCQDINECQLQGVCPNGDCLNTVGSYRCTCKQGFVPDPTLSACIQDNVMISEEKGACFRFVSAGKQCMHPLSVHLSKQLCCCSVGKAWGLYCEKCPLLGTAAFKDICPGGMGYTVSGSTRNKVNIHHPAIRVQTPLNGGRTHTIRPAVRVTVPPLPAKHEPVEALSFPQKNEYELPEQEALAPAAPDQHQVPLDDRIRVDAGQPQLSPEISTINLQPERPVVIVKTSPPVPVALGPEVSTSSASQVIAPSQITEINECRLDPQICGSGYCYDLPDGYTCICDSGFTLNVQGTRCIDKNECAETAHLCSHGRCENTEGSFLCICQVGFKASEEGTNCIDINECLTPTICGDGLCINTVGSFRCEYCNQGYRMNSRSQCEDIDECLTPSTCPSDKCINSPGSYSCISCADGYRGYNGQCLDIDECQDSSLCTDGECSNLEGSFMCTCGRGYEPTQDRMQCKDVDECRSGNLCTNGQCENLEGSFRCTCKQGYELSSAADQCEDVDECQQLGGLCREGQCRNTEGSFRCDCKPGYHASAAGDQCEDIDECQEDADPCQGGGSCRNTVGSYECTCRDGFELIDGRRCQDINECSLSTLCSPNGECLNTEGFFQCICEAGFSTSADGRSCEDIDECANSTHCGSQGFCENTEGSYRCLCYQGYQDSLDGQGCVDVNECEMLSGVCGEALCENVEGSFMCLCSDENQEYDPMTGHCIFQNSPDQLDDDKKECYYNLNDANFCDNVLTSNITKQECCCTLGAGWGDNCEIFPCPVAGSEEFTAMCPEGKGFIPTLESLYDDVSGPQYEDADECMLFGQEICKNGFCLNTQPGYECYCKQGTYYDPVKLQCLDTDECQDPSSCVNGQCINTDGSYNCFCTRPMVLDTTGTRCIRPAEYTDDVEESEVYQDLCWQHISDDFVCSRPLVGTQTSYSECCCLHGEAWGMQCALCPVKTSEDYATLCNIPVSGPRRPYGRDALVGFEDHYGPETNPRFVQDRYLNSFEELQAEECGILNGCENGRCVRVQEGYTCDCFDGYHLDMAKMKCVDVNECTELNSRMSLCKNAKCINTEGSYRCVCLPGYESSDQPNYCRPLNAAKEDSELE